MTTTISCLLALCLTALPGAAPEARSQSAAPEGNELRSIQDAIKQYYTMMNGQSASTNPGSAGGATHSGVFNTAKVIFHNSRKYAVAGVTEITAMQCPDCNAEEWQEFRDRQMRVLKEIATYSKGFEVRADEKEMQVVTASPRTLYGVRQSNGTWKMYRVPEQVGDDAALHAKLRDTAAAIMKSNTGK